MKIENNENVLNLLINTNNNNRLNLNQFQQDQNSQKNGSQLISFICKYKDCKKVFSQKRYLRTHEKRHVKFIFLNFSL